MKTIFVRRASIKFGVGLKGWIWYREISHTHDYYYSRMIIEWRRSSASRCTIKLPRPQRQCNFSYGFAASICLSAGKLPFRLPWNKVDCFFFFRPFLGTVSVIYPIWNITSNDINVKDYNTNRYRNTVFIIHPRKFESLIKPFSWNRW